MTGDNDTDNGWLPFEPPPDTDEHRAELRARLEGRAEDEGLLDIAYRTIDSPLGPLLVAASDKGILRVAFEREDHDLVLVALSSAVSPRILRGDRRTDAAARQLDDYFAGRSNRFDLPLDLRLVTGFRATVITALTDIAYGSTASYAAVANAVGNPGAVRAVGSACANNPVPIVVPCHRVVRSDGSVGQYLGGPEAKAFLLDLERTR